MVRGGSEGNGGVLEVWMGNRVTKEMVVPKKVHGGVYNDGWFGSGAAWSSDESRVAYVAQVTPQRFGHYGICTPITSGVHY